MYWFELSPETVEWGLGFWGMNRPAMNVLRQRMVEKPKEVQRGASLEPYSFAGAADFGAIVTNGSGHLPGCRWN